jgi:hypothetical protein
MRLLPHFFATTRGRLFKMKKINKMAANYTVIPLELLEDEKLSWKAKGLAAYICYLDSSRIDHAAMTLDLWKTCVDTESLDAYDELVAAGYIEDVISKCKWEVPL